MIRPVMLHSQFDSPEFVENSLPIYQEYQEDNPYKNHGLLTPIPMCTSKLEYKGVTHSVYGYQYNVYHCRTCKVRIYQHTTEPNESYQDSPDAPLSFHASNEVTDLTDNVLFLADDLDSPLREIAYGKAIKDVMLEISNQHEKWGDQMHGLEIWHLIISEELGELAEAILEHRFATMDHEAKQSKISALNNMVDNIKKNNPRLQSRAEYYDSVCGTNTLTYDEMVAQSANSDQPREVSALSDPSLHYIEKGPEEPTGVSEVPIGTLQSLEPIIGEATQVAASAISLLHILHRMRTGELEIGLAKALIHKTR